MFQCMSTNTLSIYYTVEGMPTSFFRHVDIPYLNCTLVIMRRLNNKGVFPTSFQACGHIYVVILLRSIFDAKCVSIVPCVKRKIRFGKDSLKQKTPLWERSEDMEAEAVLAEMTVNRNQTRPFKVTNKARTRKVGVVACNYSELKCKCQEKFRSLEEDVTFVIESDGTEVDSDYLEMVHSEILMFLQGDENWEPVSCPASDHADQNSDITMSIMEKLREDNRRKRTQKPMLENKKKQISVHVGWMNYRFRDKKYHLIKGTGGNPDSGPRTIKLASQSNFKEIQEFLRSTFFPNRRSFLGVEKRFQFSVGNFDGQEINEDTKLYQFIGSSTKPRIYLLSKEIPRSFDQQTDSDTDSDFLPDIRPPKRIRTHTVSSQEASGYSQDTAQTSSQAFSVSPPAVSHNLAFTPKSTSSLNTLGLTTHIPVINFEEYIQRPVVPQTTENNMNEAPVQPIRLQMQAGTPTVTIDQKTCCICFERAVDTALVPCGHLFCFVCATAQECSLNKNCSLCRKYIQSILKLVNSY